MVALCKEEQRSQAARQACNRARSGLTQYIALAEFLDVKVVTRDGKLARAFPRGTVLLSDA